MRRVLIYGYGNPSRLDDGLGPAFAEIFAAKGLPGVTVETNFQLQIEDAGDVATNDVAIFVDADISCPEPFELRRIEPDDSVAFTTHSLHPKGVMHLAKKHFGAETEGFVLGIRGYSFNDFGERLSPRAQDNLTAAVEQLERALLADRLTPFVGRALVRS